MTRRTTNACVYLQIENRHTRTGPGRTEEMQFRHRLDKLGLLEELQSDPSPSDTAAESRRNDSTDLLLELLVLGRARKVLRLLPQRALCPLRPSRRPFSLTRDATPPTSCHSTDLCDWLVVGHCFDNEVFGLVNPKAIRGPSARAGDECGGKRRSVRGSRGVGGDTPEQAGTHGVEYGHVCLQVQGVVG